MDVEIRPIVAAEFGDLARCGTYAFGHEMKADAKDRARAWLELDRTRAAFDRGRVVGASANVTSELTVPGPAVVPMAAVTWVSVLPTHRRRGLLTAMMRSLLDDARERGEPVAGLLASESVIYGRFGFGLATTSATYELDRRHAVFARPPDDPGRLRVVDVPEVEAIATDVFDRYRRTQPGEVHRKDSWWRGVFDDPEDDRDGASRRFWVVHEGAEGGHDGYASYRYTERWDGNPEHTVEVGEAIAVDPATRLSLLRYCCELDLVGRIKLPYFPLAEPLRWGLADPRRLRATAVDDVLWVRVLDVPAALGARRYATGGRVVLELDDAFLPRNSGRYELAAGPDGAAECRTTDAEADLALGAADLGAIYLGGVSLATLAAVGRVRERRPGALARAAAMFLADPPPYCDTDF